MPAIDNAKSEGSRLRGTPASLGPPAAVLGPRPSWGYLEAFLLVQYLAGALLLLPDIQSVRAVVRGLPYAASLALLVYGLVSPQRLPKRMPGRTLLGLGLAVLALSLLNTGTAPMSGLAQLVFQLSIAAPLIWADRFLIGPARLDRLLNLIFWTNAAGAVLGLLQFYDPNRFLPPEFSAQLLARNPEAIKALSFVTSDGREVVRPCGLSDLPGGAAVACATAALMGVLLAIRARTPVWLRGTYLALAGVGLVTLYLTQVRSLLLMTAASYLVMALLLVRQGRAVQVTLLAALAGGGLVGSFLVAWALGGNSVFERFYDVYQTGVIGSYQSNRGQFLEYTFTTALQEYPLGAGVGRWGMMRAYFGHFDPGAPPPLWVEIQVTGWVLDGGLPLLLLYGLAIVVALFGLYRLTIPRYGGPIAYPAAVALCAALFVVGQSFAGPTFNTSLGTQFWFLAGAVFSAAPVLRRVPRQPTRSVVPS